MRPMLENRTAIVTGAGSARGIGLATARLFAAHGARVAILDIDESGLRRSREALGDAHLSVVCDVTDKARCHAAASIVAEAFGTIDVLVNNAGVVYSTPLDEVDEAELDAVLGVNLKGNFMMAQAVAPYMRSKRRGSIVCISSIAGRVGGGVFGTAHYAAAKSGIFGLAKALARELAPHGVRANAIAPGPIDNDFTRGAMTEQMKASLAQQVPLGRIGTSNDVAGAALYLASDLSSWVTGVVLDVNGGVLIH